MTLIYDKHCVTSGPLLQWVRDRSCRSQRVIKREQDVVVWMWWYQVTRLDRSSESCYGGRWDGRRLVHVPSRKRDGKTRIRGPFVHRVCRRFGLEYRHSDPLDCGQRRGQRRRERADGFAAAGGSTTRLARALFGGWSTESSTSVLAKSG